MSIFSLQFYLATVSRFFTGLSLGMIDILSYLNLVEEKKKERDAKERREENEIPLYISSCVPFDICSLSGILERERKDNLG